MKTQKKATRSQKKGAKEILPKLVILRLAGKLVHESSNE